MKSVTRNYIWHLAYQVLIALLPLITAPYLARVLGADRIGAYSFAHSIVAFFILLAVTGTALYGQRTVAQANARGTSKKQIFIEILLLRVIGVIAALTIYFQSIYKQADEPLLYLVASIEILAAAFDISWYYQGIERFGMISVCNSIGKLAAAAGIFVLVKDRNDLNLYVLISCGSILMGNVLQWIFLPSSFEGERLTRLHVARHLKPVFTLFVSQIAIQVYTVLDKTMIGLISGSDFENGYYDQAQRLVKSLTSVVTALGTVMASRIAIVWNSRQKDREKEIEKLLLFSFRLVFALGMPISVGLTVIAARFVPIFYGEGYEPVIRLIQVLSWIIPIIGCSNIIGIQLFIPSGRENLVTRSVVAGAVTNVVLNICLIGNLGAMGAVISSVAAESTVTIIQVFLARKELPLGKIIQILVRYLSIATAMGIVGYALSAYLAMGFFGMVMIILVCVVVYVGFLVLVKDPILKELSF